MAGLAPKFSPLQGRRVAIIGYGNQGRAQALNLRDAGMEVRAGARPGGSSRQRAEEDGIPVHDIDDVCRWADVICLLVPDQEHRAVFEDHIRPALAPGDALLVAHGFSILYGQVEPPPDIDVVLVAPVGPGTALRRLFLAGSGLPGMVAVQQDATGNAWPLAMAYAAALGCTRIGVERTTFKEETETDLFGEQAVLCGGVPALMLAGFQTLVAAGYRPELAWYECIHQVKTIVDLIYAGGLSGMRAAISDTARFGAYRAAPIIVDGHIRDSLAEVLARIQSGEFARAWIAEAAAGMPDLRGRQAEEAALPEEELGRRLRSQMRLGDDL